MKKTDWLLVLATAAYSYLFYEQTAGINFLLFTILMVVLSFVKSNALVKKDRKWQFTAFASLLTAINVVIINSGLAVLANVISLILLAGFSRLPQASLFVAAINSLYSLAASALFFTFNKAESNQKQQKTQALYFASFAPHSIPVVMVPLFIFLIFLGLYSSANPAFGYLISLINFKFISWPRVWFTIAGFWLVFGFFRQLILTSLTQRDLITGDTLFRLRKPLVHAVKYGGLKQEYQGSYFLLVILNILLLFFNLSDAFYLTIGDLPADVPYSEYLHQGVYTLIFSILLAIGILLHVFRGNLNFFRQNKNLKILAYTWLLQNLLLVLLTLTKNSIYIQGTGLTYKRIGVYTYLLLTAIGLVTSFIKIFQVRNNWFLFRKNAWAFYLVLVLATCFNWDRLLTVYNLKYAQSPDLNYLNTLSETNLPEVYAHAISPHSMFNPEQQQEILTRCHYFQKRLQTQAWQSWNYNDWRISQTLSALNAPMANTINNSVR